MVAMWEQQAGLASIDDVAQPIDEFALATWDKSIDDFALAEAIEVHEASHAEELEASPDVPRRRRPRSRARIVVEFHCATGVDDRGWILPQDVVADVFLNDDGGVCLTSARTAVSSAGGSNPVWSGSPGSSVAFELAAAGEPVDVSRLRLTVALRCANLVVPEEIVATAWCDDVASVADGLPRDWPLVDARERSGAGGMLTVSVFWNGFVDVVEAAWY
mmetsp:Transcript_2997/g.10631  ORF Transcript_2997/g.10631 Transcript_2997/m.10631 type:complete len:218 (-) Transcript_2997:516-1169(-)